jgi:hypothetical protein
MTFMVLASCLLPEAGWLYPEGAQETRQTAPPTFYREVLPILQKSCQGCHRTDGIAPMPFETYEQTRPYAEAIKNTTQEKAMPPWFADPNIGKFSDDPSLTAKQIAILKAWADAKAPGGEPQDGPAPLRWNANWSIPQPDLILKVPRGIPLPAQGEVEYTYEIVPTHFS